ncbi:unnamed protein product [Blepharisma stoltei]|uniref:Uncharacterized protein n=1 Tax=Blepharisma stoltei TaxID=1481888 RepID=A0AAU9K4G7_9CILI|nr:unnamed protein product [Blepharisma stoltei]
MEEVRGTMFAFIVDFLRRYENSFEHSNSQMILRIIQKKPITLTDGFYSIESEGLDEIATNTIIRVKKWAVIASMNNLKLKVIDYEILGTEPMSEFQIKPLKSRQEIKSLMVPAFRVQMKGKIRERSMQEIVQLAREFDE